MEKTDLMLEEIDQLPSPLVPKESSPPTSRSAVLHAWIEIVLILLGLALVAILLPRQSGGDGWVRYQDLTRVMTHQSLYQPDSRYSLIGPLFSAPLYKIGKAYFGDPYSAITLYNLILFSISLLLVYFLLRNRMDRGLLRKFFLVLIYGSMFVAHLAFYYGEVFTALFVGFGLLITFLFQYPQSEPKKETSDVQPSNTPQAQEVDTKKMNTSRGFVLGMRFAVGWVAIALGVANTPATLLALGIMVFRYVIYRKRVRYFLVVVLAILFIAAESLIRRGTLWGNAYNNDHGYKTIMPYSGLPDFSYPFFLGLLSILFSFGKGLLFFAPGLLLPIRKTLLQWMPGKKMDLYKVYVLWISFLIGLIITYAQWWAWYGGLFWGPRFFLFASLPASFALAIRLLRYKEASLAVNFLTLAVFALSIWVSIDGAVFQWVILNTTVCRTNNYALEVLCFYTPEYSALWQPFIFRMTINSNQQLFLIYSLLVGGYLGIPLFVHTLRQCWQSVQKLIRVHFNVWTWRV